MAKLFIFVPAFGRQISVSTFESTHALAGALLSKGIQYTVSSFSWPGIADVRNMVLSYWYYARPESTHILFVDADIGFHPQMVLDMFTFGEPVVGGAYPKKTYPIEWAGSGLEAPESVQGFMEVEGLGFGCMLIRRDAIDAMVKKFPELIGDYMTLPDMKMAGATKTLEFFDEIKTPKGKVSEDISFCRRYRETGGKIWASVNYHMTHEGPHGFTACFAEERRKELETKKEAAE